MMLSRKVMLRWRESTSNGVFLHLLLAKTFMLKLKKELELKSKVLLHSFLKILSTLSRPTSTGESVSHTMFPPIKNGTKPTSSAQNQSQLAFTNSQISLNTETLILSEQMQMKKIEKSK